MHFSLHPDFARDCDEVTHFPLSLVLRKDDARFPWLILVPRRAGISEWFDLSSTDQTQLQREVMHTASALKDHTRADKINIAALGNLTPQLHVHVIARHTTDAAWPNPVWNHGQPRRTPHAERLEWIHTLRKITKM